LLTRPELPSPLAVVCHDAGACNVVLPWLDQPGLELRAVMQGPAAALWRARFGVAGAERHPLVGHSHLVERIDDALDGAAMLLSGTGWASALEHDARQRAARRGVRSAAVIDHWVNYPERFERAGVVQWPDEFWVSDAEAVTLVCRHFPGAAVRCHTNLYLEEQAGAITRCNARAGDVLYVLEPMRSDWGRGTPGEFQALDYFVAQRAAAGVQPCAPVRLRPHPSDPPGKYEAWIQRHAEAGYSLDRSATLAAAIGPSAWVVGCESYALVVALAAGRRVCSSLPPWAPGCRLPHAGIRHLSRSVLTPRGASARA